MPVPLEKEVAGQPYAADPVVSVAATGTVGWRLPGVQTMLKGTDAASPLGHVDTPT